MKSTKDNKSAIKFSDIVKELHSYANSEKAIDDFSSELLKIANLPEEFDLSLSYFGDDKAKNYLRKKTNLKNIILSGINKSTSSNFKNLKKDFLDVYQDYFDKYITGGNPFLNLLNTMIDFNLYYDIVEKKFVIYETPNSGFLEDFELYSEKDFSGTYVSGVDTIFPTSISDKKQNSNLLFVRTLNGVDNFPRTISSDSDLLLLKYISGVIDIKEFSTEFLKNINSNIEFIVEDYLNLSNKIAKEDVLSLYPAEIFTDDELTEFISVQLFDSENFNYLSGIFENRKDNKHICSFLERFLDPTVTSEGKILSLITSDPHFKFEELPGLKSKNKKELILKLMKKSNTVVSVVLLDIFDKDELYQMFKNTVVHQLKKMIGNKEIRNKKSILDSNYLLIGNRIVQFDGEIPNILVGKQQFSELKKEIIPLLEKIQDKVYFTLNINGIFAPDKSKSSEEKLFYIIHSYEDKYGFYYNLCKLLDWYPAKFKILVEQEKNLKCLGKISYIDKIKKKLDLDVEFIFLIHKESSIKTKEDLIDIMGDDFNNFTLLFKEKLTKTEFEDIELKKSYSKITEFASVSLSY